MKNIFEAIYVSDIWICFCVAIWTATGIYAANYAKNLSIRRPPGGGVNALYAACVGCLAVAGGIAAYGLGLL